MQLSLLLSLIFNLKILTKVKKNIFLFTIELDWNFGQYFFSLSDLLLLSLDSHNLLLPHFIKTEEYC